MQLLRGDRDAFGRDELLLRYQRHRQVGRVHRLLRCDHLRRLLLAVDIVGPNHGGCADGDRLLRPNPGRHGLDDAAAGKSDLRNNDGNASAGSNLNRNSGSH